MSLPSHIKNQAEEILEILRANELAPADEKTIFRNICNYYKLTKLHIQLVGNTDGAFRSIGYAGIANVGMAILPSFFAPVKMAISAASTLVGSKMSKAYDDKSHVANLTRLMRVTKDAVGIPGEPAERLANAIKKIEEELNRLEKVVKEETSGILKKIGITRTEIYAMMGAVAGVAASEMVYTLLRDTLGHWASLIIKMLASPIITGFLVNEGIGFANELKETPSGACMQGEGLISTTDVSAKEVETICSLRAETCMILVIHDPTKPANAAIVHFDVDFKHQIQSAINTIIQQLTAAGSLPENLQAEMFGGVPNYKYRSTKALETNAKSSLVTAGVKKTNIKYKNFTTASEYENIQRFDVFYNRATGEISYEVESANNDKPFHMLTRHKSDAMHPYQKKEVSSLQNNRYFRRMMMGTNAGWLPSMSIVVSKLAPPPVLGQDEEPAQPQTQGPNTSIRQFVQ